MSLAQSTLLKHPLFTAHQRKPNARWTLPAALPPHCGVMFFRFQPPSHVGG